MEEFSRELPDLGGDSVRVLKDGVTAKCNGDVFQKEPQNGAAVRGEAVAESDLTTIKCPSCNGHGLIGGHSGQTPESYEEHSEGCDDCDGQGKIIVSKSDLAAFVSARAADAPSEPSVVAWMRPDEITGLLKAAAESSVSRQYGRVYAKQYDPDMVAVSRAADALDSQPTGLSKADLAVLRDCAVWFDEHEKSMVSGRPFPWNPLQCNDLRWKVQKIIDASSQPTDGGVRK